MIECNELRWIVNMEIMPLYIDTAKTFMNLSSGALALTIIFHEKIVGLKAGKRVNVVMLSSWLFFLFTIGASAFYQYLAVKFLDSVSCAPAAPSELFPKLVQSPGVVYGAMLISFFVASLLLFIAAWRQLPNRRG